MLNYLLLKDFQLLIFSCCVGFVFSVKRFLFENSTTGKYHESIYMIQRSVFNHASPENVPWRIPPAENTPPAEKPGKYPLENNSHRKNRSRRKYLLTENTPCVKITPLWKCSLPGYIPLWKISLLTRGEKAFQI